MARISPSLGLLILTLFAFIVSQVHNDPIVVAKASMHWPMFMTGAFICPAIESRGR